MNNLNEGHTICYPKVASDTPSDNFGNIEVIATSSDNVICMCAIPGSNTRGRIVIDCGFTKLMKEYWDQAAGNVRYVSNCAVWLLWIEKEKNFIQLN